MAEQTIRLQKHGIMYQMTVHAATHEGNVYARGRGSQCINLIDNALDDLEGSSPQIAAQIRKESGYRSFQLQVEDAIFELEDEPETPFAERDVARRVGVRVWRELQPATV